MGSNLKSLAKSLSYLNLCFFVTTTLGMASKGIGNSEPDGSKSRRADNELEIRSEFYPTSPSPDESVAPTFIVIAQDGRTRALRYQLREQTKNVASYEGVLPGDEVQRLIARVQAAFRLHKHRKDYDRRWVYESDGFYLALKQPEGKVKEISGGLETRPQEVRALVREISELWKSLKEVPPAYAYLTARPVEKDRLRRLKREGPARLTAIESLPAALKSFLIPVVTQPINFYALTQAQYDALQRHKRPMTYKGFGYELTVISSTKEAEPQNSKAKHHDDLFFLLKQIADASNYPFHSNHCCRGNGICWNWEI